MLKLGTVFSGIGAVEHALERMGIPFEIEFACDNGDVDILSKKVQDDLNSIKKEIDYLNKLLNENNSLKKMKDELEETSNSFEKFILEIENIDVNIEGITNLFEQYIDTNYINNNQLKALNMIKKNINNAKENFQIKYFYMKLSIKLEVDIKRNILNDEIYKLPINNIFNNNLTYKKLVSRIKILSEKLEMLHERVNTENIRNKVFSLNNLSEQKSYIDSMYSKYELQNKVKKSYMANYSISNDKFHWNVSFLDGSHYRNKIDLLVGGSPCQSFSLVGKQRGLDDTRGTLFYEYARLVNEINPKVFIYENVKAILSNDRGKTWNIITRIFEDLGYDWYYKVLNSKDYGIPQNRERVFVVGFRKDLLVKNFNFPEPIELKKTMKDFLVDKVSGKYYLQKKGVDFVTSPKNLNKRYTQIDGDVQLCQKKNQQFNWHGDFIFEEENKDKEKLIEDLEKYFLSEKVKKYVLSTGTKGFYCKPEIDLDIARPLLQTMHKMHRAGVDNYVTTDGRLRKLTPRECLRLMGFCDSFKIVVSDTSTYQQSGNSIVVDVLINIIKEIMNVYPDICGGKING